MRKAIEIDETLIKSAQDLTGASTESEAVELIIRRHIVQRRQENGDLSDLVGKVDFAEDYDPKASWDRKL